MSKPTIKIHNIKTDEVIEREMNASEMKTFENSGAEFQKIKLAEAEKAAVKQSAQAKLAALGLTEEEVASIIG